MDLHIYQESASRTSSLNGFSVSDEAGPFPYTQAERRLRTAGLGLAGEVLEFVSLTSEATEDLLKKELGDIMWYVAEIASSLNVDLGSILVTGRINKSLLASIGNLVEKIKKVTAHGHPYHKEDFEILITDVVNNWFWVCNTANYDAYSILQLNIEKLALRYGTSFSPEKSFNRVEGDQK